VIHLDGYVNDLHAYTHTSQYIIPIHNFTHTNRVGDWKALDIVSELLSAGLLSIFIDVYIYVYDIYNTHICHIHTYVHVKLHTFK